MKKILVQKLTLAAFVLFLMVSCSKDNTPADTAVVPVQPTNLIGSAASPTQINLSWTDNSTNETGFKIQRRTGSENYAFVGNANADVLTYSDIGLLPSTTYIYRVYSYNTAGNSPTYSNEVTISTAATTSLPTLTTVAVSSIAATSAISGGNITSDGGASITARGVCWSTSTNPTIALSMKTNDGSGTGAFSSNISSLTDNTTYYLRAYATNSVGTAYGNQVSFTSLQNANVAPLANVTIGAQIWQSTNLDVTTYRDGTPIPQVTDATAWANLSTGAWCYYANSTANGTIYGKLYNGYAVAGIHDNDATTPDKILAPSGWHVPTDAEWTTLTTFLGGVSVAGGKMKETGTSHWNTPNTAATNSSGFNGLPGGYRWGNGAIYYIGNSEGLSDYGRWWSSSVINSSDNGMFFLSYNYSMAGLGSGANKNYGLSVRCLRD